MLVIYIHSWNPKAPGMTEEEFLPAREKFMKDLMEKKVPVKSMQAAINWEQGKALCIWEMSSITGWNGKSYGVNIEIRRLEKPTGFIGLMWYSN